MSGVPAQGGGGTEGQIAPSNLIFEVAETPQNTINFFKKWGAKVTNLWGKQKNL